MVPLFLVLALLAATVGEGRARWSRGSPEMRCVDLFDGECWQAAFCDGCRRKSEASLLAMLAHLAALQKSGNVRDVKGGAKGATWPFWKPNLEGAYGMNEGA